MKIKYILKGLIATLLLMLTVSGCESYNEGLLDGIGATREFSPIGLTAVVRNQTAVDLNWTVNENTDHYTVEFSADDPKFTTIYKTIQVSPKELPIRVQLEGETVYSIRIKAVSTTGLEDSKWTETKATTLSEQIFLPIKDEDVAAKQVTLRWLANSNVTQIVVNPGSITHTITAEEKVNGFATITDLKSETPYTAELFNGSKKRGLVAFTTGIDIGTGILVKPEDDLQAKINEAAPGATLVLMPGDYTVFKGSISLNKSITIRGLYNYKKPLLHVSFSLNNGSSFLNLIDLDLNGDTTLTDVVKYNEGNATYGPLLISGCNIHDFAKALISSSQANTKVTSTIVENSIVTNVLTNNGDFIDFRIAHIGQITLKNSTFNNCALGRDFIRIDNAKDLTGTGLSTNILIDGCTIYNKAMTASNRILYIRFVSNTTTIRNTLFGQTAAIYANQAVTVLPTFANNNYYNSGALFATAATPIKFDNSGNYTTLDPNFANAANGDFTVGNQTIKDNNIGDPRWFK
ncbi:DUF5123 domain-containing protein [Flavobacterium hydatis]|uniref:DUF5123 domain-containing protein n=1 Tax=Flavobacterium hydatis TaxID=991 RepID=A0A085ZTF6_FLAHY|nr:DUF5123 domain-containing protein [Flavobacterium hydatis]KFF07720.1 fibronectin [Flavobacterium hydatis]OXA92353.1 DUF5123 domain-containing protein [Flavobacterium hydatis]